jgi:hypothetical protein
VELESVEPVEGHDAYRLKLTMKNGDVHHVWIYQRDFHSVQGLMVPFEVESAVDGYRDRHMMVNEKVVGNPKLDDRQFAKPRA